MNLYEKIAQVMKDVTYLAKDDRVETGGGKSYKAITEEKVTTVIRESLVKNGLVIIPISQVHHREDDPPTVNKYGNVSINRVTTVDVMYRLLNIEKPDEYIDIASSGTGVDTQDKGVGKAMTYAYKYMLLRTFAIPTGEDADKISSDLYSENLYGKPDTKKPTAEGKKAVEEARKNMADQFSPDLDVKIMNLCADTGYELAAILKHYNVKSLNDMTQEQKIQSMAALKKKEKKNTDPLK